MLARLSPLIEHGVIDNSIKELIDLPDVGYVDYIELRNAIETLGGDPGEERTFYGDPDYEAMRNV